MIDAVMEHVIQFPLQGNHVSLREDGSKDRNFYIGRVSALNVPASLS